MFEGFNQGPDQQSRRRFAASTGVSLIVCIALGAVFAALAGNAVRESKPEVIEVAFHKPPPDPPAPEPAPKAAPKPPPPKPEPAQPRPKAARSADVHVITPTAIPDGELAEGDASLFGAGTIPEDGISSVVVGSVAATTGIEEAVREPPPPPPAPAKRAPPAPVITADPGVPPRPRPGNAAPAYPEDARKQGTQGLVIMRVVITEEGEVTDIEVVQGDEPFVSAAIAAVETWRYTPALVDGEPAAVERLIRIPFKLRE